MSNEHSGAEQFNDDGEFEATLREIASLGELPDTMPDRPLDPQDEVFGEAPYQRFVEIDLPDDCYIYPGISAVRVPIGDALRGFAATFEGPDSDLLIEIADIYYGREYDDDEGSLIPFEGRRTLERVAQMKWHLMQRKPDRDRRITFLKEMNESQEAESKARHEELWQPFATEKAALDEEERLLEKRRKALLDDWVEYFRCADERGSSSKWAVNRRAELNTATERLSEDARQNFDDFLALSNRAFEVMEASDA